MPKKLNDQIVRAAIDGFTAQKAHLNQQIAELREMLNGGPAQPAATTEPAPSKGRKFSAVTLRRMRAAQRLRWAKVQAESAPATPAARKATKPKRKMSPEGLKRIIAATKKRWRLQRAAATASKRRGPAKKAA